MGPLEFVVLEVLGSRFAGAIPPAMPDLVDSGLLRIVDGRFAPRSADSPVDVREQGETATNREPTCRLRQSLPGC